MRKLIIIFLKGRVECFTTFLGLLIIQLKIKLVMFLFSYGYKEDLAAVPNLELLLKLVQLELITGR